MSTRPTLLDVAARAGVSKSLVSLALRGDDGVGDATRARILAVADELGYRSNTLARSLKQGRTALLGVLLTSLANPYHTDVVAGVEDAAEAAGLTVLLSHGWRDPARLARRLDTMLDLHVDGVVVISSWLDDALLTRAARRTPVVLVGRSSTPVPGIDSLNNDDALGAELAVAHLAEHGHTRIAHLAGGTRPASIARRAGYDAAMARRGLGDLRRTVGHDAPDWRTAVDAALADGCTAVFARNDVAAVDLLDHALDSGLDLPADLSVVGYDNTALAERSRPRLTSVDQPRLTMGRRAVDLLLERLGGRTDDVHEVHRPALVERGSVAHRS
ncbi:LacI family DNA-binding transcriptional regulator [Oerskovia flava]|uniref:LacI family DNA-binding transcriptional regulator n=1 Tax=Oerskovia flava TaxID=2986422 RepID=UPI0022407F78|nr:LacI family DNA-binding transcriptional regulator [Oerskovia sp. JB1-3-2]